MPDNASLEAAAIEILYTGPYERVAGRSGRYTDVELPEALPEPVKKWGTLGPFVPPPPDPVTTASFAELRRSRTRPVRYGPAEVSSTEMIHCALPCAR